MEDILVLFETQKYAHFFKRFQRMVPYDDGQSPYTVNEYCFLSL